MASREKQQKYFVPNLLNEETPRGGGSYVEPNVVSPVAQQNATRFQAKDGRLSMHKARNSQQAENYITRPRTAALQSPESQFYDSELDAFVVEAANKSPWLATESLLKKHFAASDVIYWTYIPSLQILYSPTFTLPCPLTSSLAAQCFNTHEAFRTSRPHEAPGFDSQIDMRFCPTNSPLFVFPLYDNLSHLIAIVQVVRPAGSPEFNEFDDEYVSIFCYKFRVFAQFILHEEIHESILLDFLHLRRIEETIRIIRKKLVHLFDCRDSEIWSLDHSTNKLICFSNQIKEFAVDEGGIMGDVLARVQVLNYPDNRQHPSYNVKVDFNESESVLAVPIHDMNRSLTYGVILRGSNEHPIFTRQSEDSLRILVPFIAISVYNSYANTKLEDDFKKTVTERECLAALLGIAEILSGQLDTTRLTEIIVEKSRVLTRADRCDLLLVSQGRDQLITSYTSGPMKSDNVSIAKGIAGKAVKNCQTVIVEDAYKDPDFDRDKDLITGYRTRSVLAVPIYNNKGDVIGVTEITNKMSGTPFTEWDAHLIQILNVFCGISLENARLYNETLDFSNQLRNFFSASFTFNDCADIHNTIQELLKNAKNVIGAEAATLFLVEEDKALFSSFIVQGGVVPPPSPINLGIIGAAGSTKAGIIVNNPADDPRFNRSIDEETGFKTQTLLAAPIIDQKGKLLGVVEMVNKKNGNFNADDLKLVLSLAMFASVPISKAREKDLLLYGSPDVELHKYIRKSERYESKCPELLRLVQPLLGSAGSINFNVFETDFFDQIKLFFHVGDKLDFLEEFSISNDTIFHMLYDMYLSHPDLPFHNWLNSLDAAQFLSYQISRSRLREVFKPHELYAMILVALFNNATYDGNVDLIPGQIEPLNKLYNGQNIARTRHCEIVIKLIAKYDMLNSFDDEGKTMMWDLLIELILSTEMSVFYQQINRSRDLLDRRKFNINDKNYRILAMQLILRASFMSFMARPFDVAYEWINRLYKEFNGTYFQTPKEGSELEKKIVTILGYSHFVCQPLFITLSRLFPSLAISQETVSYNHEKLKIMLAKSLEPKP